MINYLRQTKSLRAPVLTFVLMTFINLSNGQTFSYPVIRSNAQHITDFIPAGWHILDSAYGDLNKDAISDAAIILQLTDSVLLLNDDEDTVLTNPRILLILFKDPTDNSFSLIEQSNSFILKYDHQIDILGDPYGELRINKGVLVIGFSFNYNIFNMHINSGAYTFRYQQGQFVLIGADTYSFHKASHDFESYSYNFLTGKRLFTRGNEDKGPRKTSWKSLNISPLKTLRTFTKPLSWEIDKDVIL